MYYCIYDWYVMNQEKYYKHQVIPSFGAVCTINSIKVVKYQQISAK